MTAPRPDLDALLAHADWLHRLGQQLAKDHHAAADATQDALLAATNAPPVHGQNLRGYLARALRNLLLLQQRRQQRRRARERESAARSAASPSSGAELVERAELHQFLGQCVLELPEPQRTLRRAARGGCPAVCTGRGASGHGPTVGNEAPNLTQGRAAVLRMMTHYAALDCRATQLELQEPSRANRPRDRSAATNG